MSFIVREGVLFYFSLASLILSVGSRTQLKCVVCTQPEDRGWVFIYSTHPVPIYLSAGCRERQARAFAAWLCAGSVTQYGTSTEAKLLLQKSDFD